MTTLKSVLSIAILVALALLSSNGATNRTQAAAAPASSSTIFLPLIANSVNSVPAPTWLAELNAMRALANLPPVTENATWDVGDYNHAQYMVKNGVIGHAEDPANLWYTDSGNQAAQNGNVMGTTDVNATDPFAVDLWMEGPFHAIGMIDPLLQQSAFGSYREATGNFPEMAATLDVLRGRGSTVPPGVTFPIEWPSNGTIDPFSSMGTGEYPDPLSSCSGYTYPAGMPIYLELGQGASVTPQVTSFSFKQGSAALGVCEFDQTNYANSNSSAQALGRAVLQARSAIVLIPQAPLTPGAAYSVSITTNGSTYAWSFTVSSTPRSPVRRAESVSR